MTNETIIESTLKSIEVQLAAVKALVHAQRVPGKREPLGALYGILAGKASFTDEEIEQAQYRFEWDGEEMR